MACLSWHLWLASWWRSSSGCLYFSMLFLPGSVVCGLRPNSNSWGDGIRSSRGVVWYVHKAMYRNSFSSSASSNSNLQVPIALLARLLGGMGNYNIARCHFLCILIGTFRWCIEIEVGNDSGWQARMLVKWLHTVWLVILLRSLITGNLEK